MDAQPSPRAFDRAVVDVQAHAKVAFAAPYPGTVLAMELDQHSGRLICQRTACWPARALPMGLHLPMRDTQAEPLRADLTIRAQRTVEVD